ncbi:MAG: alpha/beta fold hydrolase, partial [Streptosporangiaceae bacterium]
GMLLSVVNADEREQPMTQDGTEVRMTVAAGGGRQLEVLVAGPADGLPLVFHNGTPCGLVAFGPMTAAAGARGLRTVMYARPGYGASTPQPGRRVADAAGDVAAVLDGLGAERFVSAGWSGGGPHALATAALLPQRCLGVAAIDGLSPCMGDGAGWLAGMAAESQAEFGAAISGEAELADFLTAEAVGLRDVTAEQLTDGLEQGPDLAVLAGEFGGYLAESLRVGVAGGIAGWRDDDLALVANWGFPPGAGAPAAVWHGDHSAHGTWLAANLPRARGHRIPGAGHVSLMVNQFAMILDDLLNLAGVR